MGKNTAALLVLGRIPGLRQSEGVIAEEFPNHTSPGWDRIQVRTDYGNDLEPGTKIYKDFETIKKPISRLPDEFVDIFEEPGHTESAIADFNEIKELTANALKEIRQGFHQEHTLRVPIFREIAYLSSLIEDRLDGRVQTPIEGQDHERIVKVLKKLENDRFYPDPNHLENLREQARGTIGISVSLGEASSRLTSDPEWNDSWTETANVLKEDILVGKYPVIASGLREVRLTADITETVGSYAGVAHRQERAVEVQTDRDFLKVFFHELKHYPQVNWLELFDGSGNFTDLVENAPLKETFKLFSRTIESAGEIASIGDDIATNSFLASSTVMREQESVISKTELESLANLARKLGISYEGSEEHIEELMTMSADQSRQTFSHLNAIAPAGSVLLAVLHETKSRDLSGALNESEIATLTRLSGYGFDQLIHFLVNPAVNVSGGWRLRLNQEEDANTGIATSEQVANILNNLDGHYQEWMSGGEVSAQDFNDGTVEPYGAWVVRLAGAGLDIGSLDWTIPQLLPHTGTTSVDELNRSADEYKEKIRPFLGDSTDTCWETYVSRAIVFSPWITNIGLQNPEDFASPEEYVQFLDENLNSCLAVYAHILEDKTDLNIFLEERYNEFSRDFALPGWKHVIAWLNAKS